MAQEAATVGGDRSLRPADWDGWSDRSFALEMQEPWAGRLLSGKKTIEVRAYALPADLIGRRIYILQSAQGSTATSALGNQVNLHEDHQVKLVGWCIFSEVKEYTTEPAFNADSAEHLVSRGGIFCWKEDTERLYGWQVEQAGTIVSEDSRVAIRRLRSIFELVA